MPENHAALGFLETPFLSLSAVIADRVCKASGVELLGFEPTGAETILARLQSASIDALQHAVDSARSMAAQLGSTAIGSILPNPAHPLFHLNDHPNSINPLYGGREELRPTDHPPSSKPMNIQAIGILETQGLTAILQATDTMLKAADVELVGKEKIGAAYVTIIIRGDVAAVQSAIDAGAQAVGSLGKVIAAHVIARPHESLLRLLPG